MPEKSNWSSGEQNCLTEFQMRKTFNLYRYIDIYIYFDVVIFDRDRSLNIYKHSYSLISTKI